MIKSRIEDDNNFIDVVTFSSPGIAEEDEVPAALAISTVFKGSDGSPSAGGSHTPASCDGDELKH